MPRLDRQLVREVRRRQRRPHIFSTEEIRKLFQTALAFPSPRAPLRPHSLHTMLVLAYCAGLRLGEIARLTIGDVRIEQGVIEVPETKFFKTRHLPLSPSALAALGSYMDARKKAGGPSDNNSTLLWHQQAQCGYSRITVESLLARVLRRAGVKPPRPSGRTGPRIHDLRHTFVVHRMTEWYRASRVAFPQDDLMESSLTRAELEPLLLAVSRLGEVRVVRPSPYLDVGLVCFIDTGRFDALAQLMFSYKGRLRWILTSDLPRLCITVALDASAIEDVASESSHAALSASIRDGIIYDIPKLASFLNEKVGPSAVAHGVYDHGETLELPMMPDAGEPPGAVYLVRDVRRFTVRHHPTSLFDRCLHFWISDYEQSKLLAQLGNEESSRSFPVLKRLIFEGSDAGVSIEPGEVSQLGLECERLALGSSDKDVGSALARIKRVCGSAEVYGLGICLLGK